MVESSSCVMCERVCVHVHTCVCVYVCVLYKSSAVVCEGLVW